MPELRCGQDALLLWLDYLRPDRRAKTSVRTGILEELSDEKALLHLPSKQSSIHTHRFERRIRFLCSLNIRLYIIF